MLLILQNYRKWGGKVKGLVSLWTFFGFSRRLAYLSFFVYIAWILDSVNIWNEVIVDSDMSETTVAQFRESGTEPLPAHKLASLSLFKVVTLSGHPPSLHPIYKRPKGLFSVNAFYMNPSLCLCKPTYSSKQSPIEAELLNLRPDGFSNPETKWGITVCPEGPGSARPSLWPRSEGGVIYSLSP